MMVASVPAHTHFNYDGSRRAGFAIWTMAASVLAYPLQLYDGSQRAGSYPLQL